MKTLLHSPTPSSCSSPYNTTQQTITHHTHTTLQYTVSMQKYIHTTHLPCGQARYCLESWKLVTHIHQLHRTCKRHSVCVCVFFFVCYRYYIIHVCICVSVVCVYVCAYVKSVCVRVCYKYSASEINLRRAGGWWQ